MSARNRTAARARFRRRYRVWYAYDASVSDDEASGTLIVAATEAQVRSIWRRDLGLTTADIDADDIEVQPAVWARTDLPEPPRPRKAGVWWPCDAIFRGYGLHFVDDDCCDYCGEYVDEVDEDGLCPDCADPVQNDPLAHPPEGA